MERYIRSSSYAMLHITIDEVTPLTGKFYNPTQLEPIAFKDVNELIIKADELLNDIGNPMPSVHLRTFSKDRGHKAFNPHPEVKVDYEIYDEVKGKIKTLDVVVVSRHNASWQGIVFSNDEAYEFDNLMTLLHIISREVSYEA